MTTALLIIAVTAIAYMAHQNRQLRQAVKALADKQEQTDARLDKLSKRSRKHTNTARRHEAKIERLHRKQREQADRQQKIEVEQRKQAISISKLEFKVQTALADIQHHQNRINQLYAILDIVQAEQSAAQPGSKADVSTQRQIITIENQIANAEKNQQSTV